MSMKKLTQHSVERIILLLTFVSLSFMNLDFYFNAFSIFFALLLTISFLVTKTTSEDSKKLGYSFYIFSALYLGIIILFIPDFFQQFYLVMYAPIGILIVLGYFIIYEDKANEYIANARRFNYINILSIVAVYSLVGFNPFLMAWFIALILFNVAWGKIYIIRTFLFVFVMATLVIVSNKSLNNMALMYLPDFDTGFSAIGSDSARVTLRNKVLFSGKGELPHDHLFYNYQFSVLQDFENEKIEWSDLSVRKVDYDFMNVMANIRNKTGASGLLNSYTGKDYYDFYRNKDNYVRMQLNYTFIYFRFYYPELNKEPTLKHTGFINFFDIVRSDTKLDDLSFKHQFLKKEAIPVEKELTLKSPLQIMGYMPPGVISIKSDVKNRTYYKVYGDSIAAVSREREYQNLKITYLDSMYVSYRTPFKEDLYLSDKYKNIIKLIAPEIGIKETDDVYTKQRKIHNWFASNFKYTLKLKYNGKPRSIEDFLLRDRRGHCEYFATATALISRYYGIPSQYATGIFIDQEGDSFSGNRKKGHAWNLFWDGAGWIKVDNTVSTFDNETPKWISDLSSNLNLDFIKNLFSSNKGSFLDILASVNKMVLFAALSGIVLAGLIVYILMRVYRNKHKDRILERKLRKDLKAYLKKYPKEDYIPWKMWAISTGEEYCLKKVNEYYKVIYSA